MKHEHGRVIRINGSKQIIALFFFKVFWNDFRNSFYFPATVEYKWTIATSGKFLISRKNPIDNETRNFLLHNFPEISQSFPKIYSKDFWKFARSFFKIYIKFLTCLQSFSKFSKLFLKIFFGFSRNFLPLFLQIVSDAFQNTSDSRKFFLTFLKIFIIDFISSKFD